MSTQESQHGIGQRVGAIAIGVLLIAAVVVLFMTLNSARPSPANADPNVPGPNTVPSPTPTATSTASGEKIDAILNSALTYMNRDEAAKAEIILAAAIRENPGEQRLYLMHAEALAALRKPEDAYAAYEKALAIGPREGETEFAAGTLANMIGKLDRAVEHYQAAQAAMKTDPRPPVFLAQVQLKLKQNEEAKGNLAIAARLNPDLAIVWGTWAQVELDENRPSIAAQHAAKARELEPRVTLWRLLEARALRRANKAEEALALLVNLDDGEKRDPQVMSVMGECYGILKRPADAAALYAKAADADPANGTLAMETAGWFERAGDKATALKHAERAMLLGTAGASGMVERLKQP